MNKRKIIELVIVGIIAGVSVNLITAKIEAYKNKQK